MADNHFRLFRHSDFVNFVISNLIMSSSFYPTQNVISVHNIFGPRNPFQIIRTVVRFIAIYMVHLWKIIRIWYKKTSNYPMNCSLFADMSHKVAAPMFIKFKNPAFDKPFIITKRNLMAKASNISETTCLILTIITNYVFPYFHNEILCKYTDIEVIK